ncbi:hydrolase [Flavobacterium rhamnosiphilum]|uniref:Hydrolase n=1 Tax=Flavobacterium rhamnosiphilum TaxID=2541724 RepID=A0A4R5FDT3_9FLAO|nr:DUF5916 domain-containing protein [Flavobacterium rhamnosiphilum]TDE47150.1 hydrolase [Flavobacterium rhamnosiphilum]
MKNHLLLCFLLLYAFGYSQKKVLQTKFISEKIEIDGKLDENTWQTASIANDFIMFQPDNGKPIPENKKTEVKVLYNNDAIYVAALLYDNEPDKILKEISQRDDLGTSDFFGVFINGYNDGQQDFRFYVTASNGQLDCVATEGNDQDEDFSWDAVWKSKATITDFGWVVEMRIPYAALRFSGEKKQTWGLNFFREIRRDRQKYTWNFIDAKIGSFTQQAGVFEGIENIKTPTRLFLLPYSSFYVNANAEQKTYGTIKGGMDIKYGINDAFTLDAILVPDFGQTKYDNKILNLGPFEQRFDENRSFFTEGTDLFNKGNLLYSRRIGGRPFVKNRNIEKTTDEIIEEYPNAVSLINAIKISGRTKNGLGIGVLNAVTENTSVTIRDTKTGQYRRVLIDPLTNYNVVVLDQRFLKNSSVSFVNTNVTRDGNFRDGNVSALVWNLNTKKNTYGLSGDIKYSFINAIEDQKGLSSQLNLSKNSGKYRFFIGGEMVTKDYNIDDLGINNETNYYNIKGNANYRILNPTKTLNGFRINYNMYAQFHKETGKNQVNNINVNAHFTTKKNHNFGFGTNYSPFESYDYYGPQTQDRFIINPKSVNGWGYISSNYNYKFALDIEGVYVKNDQKDRNSYEISLSPRFRFNDRFSLVHSFNFNRQNNDKGYVDNSENNADLPHNTVVFANRNVVTYSNTLTGKYSINSQMNFNIALRHYWSYAENKNFLYLEQNGRLTDYPSYTQNKNASFNSWNFDLSYSWWFAPGSQVSVLYRNSAFNGESEINKNFRKNVNNLLNNDILSHVFSVSVKYFIDFNSIKNMSLIKKNAH